MIRLAQPRGTGVSAGHDRPKAGQTTALLCILLVSVLTGCGYQVGGKGSQLPTTLHTIAVPAFQNITTKYKLTNMLPEEIAHEFITRTHYKVVTNPLEADAVLEGKVYRYYTAPTVYDPSLSRSSGVEVYIWMNVTLKERATGKELWKRTAMEVRERYEITGDQRSYIDESDAALGRLSKSVARQIVSSILEAW